MSPPTSQRGKETGQDENIEEARAERLKWTHGHIEPTTAAPGRMRLRVMDTLLESPRNGRSGKKKAVKSDTRRNDSGNRRIRTRRAPRSGVP